MARIFRKLSQLLDLDETNKTAGYSVVVNSAEDGYELADVSGGGGGTDDQTAAEVPFTPAGNLASTDVQAALEELDSEKAAVSHVHAGEDITSGTVADARIASTIARDSEVSSAISALSSVYQAKDTTLDTYAGIDPSANVQSVLSAADYAAIRALLGLVIGTNVQAYDADLTTWAGLTPSAFFQTLVEDTDADTARATLGVIASLFEDGGAQEISIAGLAGTPAALQAHLDDTSDAHDASAVSVADSGGNYTATDVEGVLAEIAPQLGGGGVGTLVVKASTESVSSSTSVQADDELFFPVADGHAYWFRAVVIYDEPANSGTPDFKWAMDDSGGSSVAHYSHAGRAVAGSGQGGVANDDAVTVTNAADQNTRGVTVEGVIYRESGGADNFGLWWAQNTSSSNAVRVLAGSFLEWRQLT